LTFNAVALEICPGYWQTVALRLLPLIVQCAQRYFSRVAAEISEALGVLDGVKVVEELL
jgi:hypothetical protein